MVKAVKEVRRKIKKPEKLPESCINVKTINKFIPLMCVLQVIVHYSKTDYVGSLLRSNPLNPLKPWQFLTTCLVHSSDWKLWSNVLAQLFFGLPLESVLKWKCTAVIYLSSVLSASILTWNLQEIFYMSAVGSYQTVFGLAAGCILGNLLTNNQCISICTILLASVILLSESLISLYTIIGVLHSGYSGDFSDFTNVVNVSNFFGCFGGFTAGVNIWYHKLQVAQRVGWKLQLRGLSVFLSCLVYSAVLLTFFL